MGYYIHTGQDTGKGDFLIAHGATELLIPDFFSGDFMTVCVVDNGRFEAAGIAFNKREFEAFKAPDSRAQRARRWFKVPRAVVEKFCPNFEELKQRMAL